MFAILLSDVMDPFYENITSFPTVFFTCFLVFCFFYWILALVGLVDLDFLDFDIDVDSDGSGDLGPMAGVLLKLGLAGIPLPIVMSSMTLAGFFICYYAVYFIFPLVPFDWLEYLVGVPILLGSLYFSAVITGWILKPLRPMFETMNQDYQKEIVGQVAVVRTSRVDNEFGEAVVEDGGAGLIVKVRSFNEEETFARGDRVVLLEFVREQHFYRVISEAEFTQSSGA